ncbi:hypothetical protein LPJ61_000217 [Coemansia biformis]|uniref:HSF-type DNA-binding domain-containing protein n=1 Tax=Coemansia biformis TaxID=1286918 RepID=A0A9W8D1A0_9FUNG|nr:hypothetical protein LPJ61_000217 [Coemansia biformis]
MPVLRLVDAVSFSRPAAQGALQAADESPLLGAGAPASSSSPYDYERVKDEHPFVGFPGAAATWAPPAPALTKFHDDVASSFAAGAAAGNISMAAYPTPSQSLPARASAVGSLLDAGYTNPGAMFGSPALPVPDRTMGGFAAAISVDLAAALPAASSFSPFAAAAVTPIDTHQNSKASSASPQSSLLHHPGASPGMAHPTLPHSRVDNGPTASAMLRPIPRPLEIHPLPAMPSFDEIAAGAALPHSEPASASIHGPGMGSTGSVDSGLNSAEGLGFGFATPRPSSSGNKDSNAMFPSLLYRICTDPALDAISYWDENNYVCIPDMEKLRLKLNALGMTANHTDSLQKNFNDYQFKRQTDQRRIRHTGEMAIVKFSNDNFLPGREDLLVNVMRKSAIKKSQNNGARERQSGPATARRRARVPSIRQGGARGGRQAAAERAIPYARHLPTEHGPMSGFSMPISPTGSFPVHQGHGSAGMQPIYTASEMPGLMVPLSVPGLGFSIPHHVHMAERPEPTLIPATGAAYSQAPLYIDHAPGLVVHGLMHQPAMGLSAPFQGSYHATLPPRQHVHAPQHLPHFPHYQHQEHSPQQMPMFSAEGDQHHGQIPFPPPIHPTQHPGHPHQYQVFASPGDVYSQPTPPHGVKSENHHLP